MARVNHNIRRTALHGELDGVIEHEISAVRVKGGPDCVSMSLRQRELDRLRCHCRVRLLVEGQAAGLYLNLPDGYALRSIGQRRAFRMVVRGLLRCGFGSHGGRGSGLH